MTITSSDFRLSWVWTRGSLEILLDPQAASRLNFLGRRFPYQQAFAQAAGGGPTDHGLEAPWKQPPGEPFWSHYLEGAKLPNVEPNKAWRAIVPFRRQVSAGITVDGFTGRIVAHGFFYPHGVGLVVDATCREPTEVGAAVDVAVALQTGSFTLDRNGTQSSLDLEGLADTLLNDLTSVLLDRTHVADDSPGPPFQVFTPVSGYWEGPFPDPEAHDLLRRALHGAATANVHWRDTPPPPLAESRLDTGVAVTGHLVHAAQRGRSVWFPRDFAPSPAKQTLCSDYHRGLVLTSLQVESMCGFLSDTVGHLEDQPGSLQAVHQDSACIVAGLLGRLYGDVKPFPRTPPRYSSSVRPHVDANGYVKAIADVREEVCNLSSLHVPPTATPA